jgi:hypothetical protein
MLDVACAPLPFVVVAMAPTFDDVRDEKEAHRFFADVRRAGEFFELCNEDVITYFETNITVLYNSELAQFVSRLR